MFLALELLSLINVGEADFQTTECEAYAHHIVTYKRLLVHTVTIPEGVAIEEDISQDPRPTHGGKNMDSKPLVTAKKTGVRLINRSVCI